MRKQAGKYIPAKIDLLLEGQNRNHAALNHFHANARKNDKSVTPPAQYTSSFRSTTVQMSRSMSPMNYAVLFSSSALIPNVFLREYLHWVNLGLSVFSTVGSFAGRICAPESDSHLTESQMYIRLRCPLSLQWPVCRRKLVVAALLILLMQRSMQTHE
jgi:hypothetical protein